MDRPRSYLIALACSIVRFVSQTIESIVGPLGHLIAEIDHLLTNSYVGLFDLADVVSAHVFHGLHDFCLSRTIQVDRRLNVVQSTGDKDRSMVCEQPLLYFDASCPSTKRRSSRSKSNRDLISTSTSRYSTNLQSSQ